jgi:hypothetical protein
MEQIPPENDPGRWGASLINVREVLRACLDARGTTSVVEVGAYEGELTRELLAWAEPSGARITAIDPTPQDRLRALEADHPELDLIRETSHGALAHIDMPDAVIIDGDHNYYTVSEELRIIGERAGAGALPLLIFHDVGWPHARRDSYYAPERIPDEARQPVVERGGIAPGEPGIVAGGLPLPWVADHEGGERNGVLTAIEDFLAGRNGLRLATLPMFFGFGVLFDTGAEWAGSVAAVVDPWDRNPILERLESNRVYHIAAGHQLYSQVIGLERQASEQRRELERTRRALAEQEALLQTLLDSGAFAVAERLSRLRQRGTPAISRERVRRALRRDDTG